MTGVNFVLTKFGGKQGFPLLVPSVLLIVQTLLFSTSALPAKSGPSSKSLEYAGLPVSYSQVENNKNSLEPKDTSVIPNGPFKITVYPWNNHLGRPAPMEWSEDEVKIRTCKEIPARWQGKVKSVDTHTNCIVLFSRHNCEGNSKVLKIGSPSHNRLSDLCFQRKPTSVRPCTQEENDA